MRRAYRAEWTEAMAVRGAVRHVEWVGDEDPERLEAATVTLAPDRLDALGVSRTTDYVASWSLETGPDWVTTRLDVSVTGRGFTRWLVLRRDTGGRWTSESWTHGSGDFHGATMAAPGLADAESVHDALDCDLALCPVTNTMPVLRLGALRGVEETELTMAWVDLPSLEVRASRQAYSGVEPFDAASGRGVVRYRSADRGFIADLGVDEDGLVIDYPRIARRIRTGTR
ncbi:putative glycolipid-binding domain-containing protein [Leifsonia sp. NPDC058194]|uniref:putative glycolipid-binding domain-containing protein n=1 Tax=Leifsonia sp. NPDC058194 TaxID=3346374 RepID=UPI0036D7D343